MAGLVRETGEEAARDATERSMLFVRRSIGSTTG